MQNKDYVWFLNNYNSIYKKYGSCFVAIKSKKIIGYYKSYKEALINTSKKESIGTFIIQECGPSKSKSTICTISSIL